MCGAPAKSAMVLLTFMMRWYALALKFNFSIAAASMALLLGPSGQKSANSLFEICALV
jgi:hypothetical protein